MFYKYHKKSGDFSNKTIRGLQKELGAKKIGHSGILDPLASGLIIFATDFETKLLPYIADKTKTYIAKCKFNYKSDTYDVDGKVEMLNNKPITKQEFLEAMEYVKTLKFQIPPIYSAKKINGKKAYEYAREQKEVELRKQPIEIFAYNLINFDEYTQEATVELKVSEGAYVRTVLVDTAQKAGTNCVMTYLKRVSCGNVSVDDLFEERYEQIQIDKLLNLKKMISNNEIFKFIRNGNEFKVEKEDGDYLLYSPNENEVWAIGQVIKGIFKPKKVSIERINLYENNQR
ncbi:tRNA pseudouridine(55) synthase TruB [Mycoplasma sp. 4463]|uniref:tRNA pseudouridine(55) synthase TruB n=1 Tax=Mycoplasma sp. 4463 TaxID=3400998 RepID=UPI003AAEF25C